MAIDFPASPTTGQTYFFNGVTYKFSAQGVWEVVGSAAAILTVNVQVFSIAGAFTYTPIAGMKYCTIECAGGGGGGGGCTVGSAGSQFMMGGGGGGGYSRKTVTAAIIGASKTGTIGAGGTAGTTGGSNGGNGGQTTLTGICTANGGLGGKGAVDGTYQGGAGGSVAGAVGDVMAAGAPGQGGFYAPNTVTSNGGSGGPSYFGGGALGPVPTGIGAAGAAGTNYGSGGAGCYVFDANAARAGGAGAPGVVIITEYL